MTKANTIAILYEWIKIIPIFCRIGKKNVFLVKQNQEPRNTLTHDPLIIYKGTQGTQMGETIVSSMNSVGNTRNQHAEQWKWTPILDFS